MICEYLRHTARQFLACGDVKEFIGAVGIRVRPQHSRDQELRLRILLAKHIHEGDRSSLSHIGSLIPEEYQ